MSRLRAAIIYLGRRLPAASSSLPEGLGTSSPRRGRMAPPAPRPLLGLAPGGVCLAGPVTQTAGEPLPHLFTLTFTAVCFCGTVHRVAPPGCYPAPCSVELGLSSDGFSIPLLR